MMVEKKGNTQGIGIIGVLQITFIVLKLTENIDWTWPWVLSPIIIPAALVIGGGIILGITNLMMIGFGIKSFEDFTKKKKNDEQK
jgi:hypothetical protein